MADIESARRIHLIGIGGCSMNGLAQILKAQGHLVSGSDREQTPFTAGLAEQGIPVSIGHTGEYERDAELVIYSAAIKPDNPERKLAEELHIPTLERSVALGQISERFEEVVAVAGCHGKTTIVSMLAYINEFAQKNATVHVGGFVDFLHGGTHVGGNDLLITEACEYVESFLTLSPTIILINNIDDDHLDYYKDIAHITDAFRRFLSLLPVDGTFIACTDDVRVRALMQNAERRAVAYGLASGDIHAENIAYADDGCAAFDLIAHGKPLGRIALSVPGQHNVINALGAYAVAEELRIPFETFRDAIAAFHNTRRRFELYGTLKGARVYHDYGHHPSEIAATLDAASRMRHNKLYCVFQCNSYTRAKTLFCVDTPCFKAADRVLVPDIYPGREKDTGTVHARDMVDSINRATGNAVYLGTFEKIRAWLDENVQKDDLIVTVGSGDVYRQTEKLIDQDLRSK